MGWQYDKKLSNNNKNNTKGHHILPLFCCAILVLLLEVTEATNDINFQICFVIPFKQEDATFVHDAIYENKHQEPVLRYAPPLSAGKDYHKKPDYPKPLTMRKIADWDAQPDKVQTAFTFSSESVDTEKKKMGLRLLSELLHNKVFREKNHHLKPLIANLQEKLKESGVQLPPPLGGAFQLKIFDGKGAERQTLFIPAKLKLFQSFQDTHETHMEVKEGQGIVKTHKPRSEPEDPNWFNVRLEVVDPKDAMKKKPMAQTLGGGASSSSSSSAATGTKIDETKKHLSSSSDHKGAGSPPLVSAHFEGLTLRSRSPAESIKKHH